MVYKQLEELITMGVQKANNQQSQDRWKELKVQHTTIYGICELIYDKQAAILKEDLNSFFNFRLLKKCQFKINSLFTIKNNIKTLYINPYMQNKVFYEINCESLILPREIDKNRVYLVATTNSLTSLSYGYYTQNNKLVLLNNMLKETIITPPKIIPLNEPILNLHWRIVEYQLLENPYEILCKFNWQ